MKTNASEDDAGAGTDDDLVVQRPEGLYCPPGDFYIDPWRPVDRAVHHPCPCRPRAPRPWPLPGRRAGEGVLRARLGDITLQTLAYGEAVEHRGVRISLHPAGHVLGSAQVRLEHGGRVWVASGDYFVSGVRGDDNPTCAPFEPVRCDCFITESHLRPADLPLAAAARGVRRDQRLVARQRRGRPRQPAAGLQLRQGAAPAGRAWTPSHRPDPRARRGGAAERGLPRRRRGAAGHAARHRRAPTRRCCSARWWSRRPRCRARPGRGASATARDAFASGWMQLRGARRRQGVDRGFVLRDHADWPGLQRAIAATGAERVIVTHGYEAVMVRWLPSRACRPARSAPSTAATMASRPAPP